MSLRSDSCRGGWDALEGSLPGRLVAARDVSSRAEQLVIPSPEERGGAERLVLAGQHRVAADPLSLSLQLNCGMQNLSVKNSNSNQ